MTGLASFQAPLEPLYGSSIISMRLLLVTRAFLYAIDENLQHR